MSIILTLVLAYLIIVLVGQINTETGDAVVKAIVRPLSQARRWWNLYK